MVSSHDAQGIALRELARRCGAEVVGDGDVMIDHVATLEAAQPRAIAFLSNPKYRSQLAATRASAVIVGPRDADATALPRLVTSNPYAAYARVAAIFHPAPETVAGIHASAVIAASARVCASAMVGPHVVVGERAEIGERAQLHAGCIVGDDCVIGNDAVINAAAVLYPRSLVGARTIVHSGAVIGADGF